MNSLQRYKLAWPWMLLDATFLYGFTLVAQHSWISYGLLAGLFIGLLSLRWWLADSQQREDTALGLLCFVLPCTTLAAQFHARR